MAEMTISFNSTPFSFWINCCVLFLMDFLMDWGTWNLESFNLKPKSDYRNDGFVLKDKSFGPGKGLGDILSGFTVLLTRQTKVWTVDMNNCWPK